MGWESMLLPPGGACPPAECREKRTLYNVTRVTIQVGGMMCGMSEAHINEAVRRSFRVKKVTSSHNRGETVILTGGPIHEEKLRRVVRDTGHEMGAITQIPYEKKPVF